MRQNKSAGKFRRPCLEPYMRGGQVANNIIDVLTRTDIMLLRLIAVNIRMQRFIKLPEHIAETDIR